MEPIRDPAIQARFRATLDLFDFAEQVMRQNLRRRHPEADEEEIERRLVAWLHRRETSGSGDP